MIRNYYYLIVGLLLILFAVTHTVNGVMTGLPVLHNADIENDIKITFTYVWHVIGIENLVLGIALLIMAFQKNMSKVKFTTWVIIVVLIMRWIIITSFTLLDESGSIKQIIPDTIAFFGVITLLLIGTRIKVEK